MNHSTLRYECRKRLRVPHVDRRTKERAKHVALLYLFTVLAARSGRLTRRRGPDEAQSAQAPASHGVSQRSRRGAQRWQCG